MVFVVNWGHRVLGSPPRGTHTMHGWAPAGGYALGTQVRRAMGTLSLAGTAQAAVVTGAHSWAAKLAAGETGCLTGSKILLFPFWRQSITRLPLLFLLPFSLA